MSLESLAEQAGIDADALLETVKTYNNAAEAGHDERFFKDAALLKTIRRPPFYAVRYKPASVALTATGLSIDAHARVLDEAGRQIPGLYAAGETTGGVLGKIYTASGNSIANAIIFGRTAGRNAALFAKK